MNNRGWVPEHSANGARNGSVTHDRRVLRRRSEARHAATYESLSPTTVRAVTPESSAAGATDITALPSPTSFPPQNPSRLQSQDLTISVSNTDEEGTIESRRRKVKKKAKHKDTIQADTSPNSFFEKTRKRLNSITTSAPSPRLDDPSLSIGFPSIVQASVFPEMQEIRHTLPRTPRRTLSSDTATTTTVSSLRSPMILESDSDNILKLMKALCGRMHGILFYRPIGTTSWHSGYCAINVAPGSLVCQSRSESNQVETLIPDLRGCTVRTNYDPSVQSTHLSVVLPVSGFGYQLRPSVPETFDSWLAALLCWQPLKPKGIYNRLAKPQSIAMMDRSNINNRRLSDISTPRGTAVVKSSQMLTWDGPLPAGSYRHQAKKLKIAPLEDDSWRRVNCTLHENGTLRLLAEENATLIRSVKLHNLARCAIQRLDESVLGTSYCIAIHPQYTIDAETLAVSTPLVLSLGTRVAFEAWFVLLQAMTVPELYGPEIDLNAIKRPKSSDDSRNQARNMFRIERSLLVKIVEAKFSEDWRLQDQQLGPYSRELSRLTDNRSADIYVDVLLGRDLRARTVSKAFSKSIFWAEEFFLVDIPSMLSRVSIVLKTGNPDEKEWTMTPKDEYAMPEFNSNGPAFEAVEVASHDPVCGRVDVPLYDLENDKFVEKWWPLIDANGSGIGSALIRLSLEENVVLMEAEYAQLTRLLHNFDNSLTSQLGQVLSTELKRLSDVLLDIFQTTDKVEDWISNLVDEEIDGIYREQTPSIRMRYSGRVHSNDSYESAEHRELLVRDLSRSATTEANLLFRGNSLVTKVIEAHMRRIGKDYLERTLGEKVRTIIATNPNCEVDPNKVSSAEQLDRNWSNLVAHTSSIWQAIAASVPQCPPGMRMILKHVGSCADDRYGSFIRTVKYTSVSGFLFLRFYCAAILNPKLFGLLEDHPPERARRTFTLIAKSLIVLANLSKFGQKEPWMEPMNRFLTAATNEFKIFIDGICSWSVSEGVLHEPQYQAAQQVKQRLPLVSREGLLSLPFLLDPPKSLATLVDLWMLHAPSNIVDTGVDDSVKTFHHICIDLKQRVKDCMADAEMAQEPNSRLEKQWQKLLNEQPKGAISYNPFVEPYPESEITALPQPTDFRVQHNQFPLNGPVTVPSKISGDERDIESPQEINTRTMTSSTNSSNVSFDGFDDPRNRQHVSSKEGSKMGRFFDRSKRRKGRIEQNNETEGNFI